MAIDYRVLAQPKPESCTTAKRREKRVYADRVAEIRAYVQGRERGMCRCCRKRSGASMHELRPRSLGGKVSKTNSVWVCGDGVQGCHGLLQRHEIRCLTSQPFGAEGPLSFEPNTRNAEDWLGIKRGDCILSEPMRAYEGD